MGVCRSCEGTGGVFSEETVFGVFPLGLEIVFDSLDLVVEDFRAGGVKRGFQFSEQGREQVLFLPGECVMKRRDPPMPESGCLISSFQWLLSHYYCVSLSGADEKALARRGGRQFNLTASRRRQRCLVRLGPRRQNLAASMRSNCSSCLHHHHSIPPVGDVGQDRLAEETAPNTACPVPPPGSCRTQGNRLLNHGTRS